MMNKIKLVLTAISMLIVSACSSSGPIMTGNLADQSKPILNGKIVNIEDIEVSAPLIPRLIGTMTASNLVRNYGGNGVARVTAGVAGSLLTNKIYDRHADKITVRSDSNEEFQAIVPTGYFGVNNTIRFTLNEDEIESIEREILIDDI
jgi:outer membrane lipoprotein SlyB